MLSKEAEALLALVNFAKSDKQCGKVITSACFKHLLEKRKQKLKGEFTGP